MSWHFRPWHPDDLALAARMKPADADEARASHGLCPACAIRESVEASHRAEAIVVAGAVEGVWGCARVRDEVGQPWMLSSERLTRDARELVTHGRRIIAELHAAGYAVLFNHVDERNRASLAWLSRIGFRAVETTPFGVAGLPFVLMVSEV